MATIQSNSWKIKTRHYVLANLVILSFTSLYILEPYHEIVAVFVLRKLILQKRMRNHPRGAGGGGRGSARCLIFGRTLCLFPYLMCACLSLRWRLCNKYHNIISWLNYSFPWNWRLVMFNIVILIASTVSVCSGTKKKTQTVAQIYNNDTMLVTRLSIIDSLISLRKTCLCQVVGLFCT